MNMHQAKPQTIHWLPWPVTEGFDDMDYDPYNPLLVLRKEADLSQVQVAELIDVSEQYVRRLDQGLVSAPKGAYAHMLWEYHSPTTKAQIDELMQKYRTLLSDLAVKAPIAYHGRTGFSSARELELFISDWWDFWIKVKRLDAPVAPKPGTIYELCRRLALHPYVVTNYLRGTSKVLPVTIQEALNQTDRYTEWVEIIEGFRRGK